MATVTISKSGDYLIGGYTPDALENNTAPEVLDIIMSGNDQSGAVKTITVTWKKNADAPIDDPQLTPYTYTSLQGAGEMAKASISADSHVESDGVVTSTYSYTFVAGDVGLYLAFSFTPKISGVQNTTGLAETAFYTGLVT